MSYATPPKSIDPIYNPSNFSSGSNSGGDGSDVDLSGLAARGGPNTFISNNAFQQPIVLGTNTGSIGALDGAINVNADSAVQFRANDTLILSADEFGVDVPTLSGQTATFSGTISAPNLDSALASVSKMDGNIANLDRAPKAPNASWDDSVVAYYDFSNPEDLGQDVGPNGLHNPNGNYGCKHYDDPNFRTHGVDIKE